MFSKLGRFEIKDILGRGAMGEVYLGVDPILGREVAIKTIMSSALPEDQARQRFDREAKAAAVLNSPNIVTIHELGEDQGVLFIAMERLKGQDLEQILLQRSLTLVESLEVLAQVCDGLDVAHRNHIIHRDIKPSNIMVMREGRKLLVKLMDFGVARLKDSAMTMIGTVVGTVNYIAPEYIRSGEPDARSDLFAVGVMLYECIAGKKPFDGGSASTVLFKIVNDPPDPLDLSMLHGLNPALRNMTEKALAKDPDDRFQSAEEFALALRAAKDPAWNGRLEETTVRMNIQPMGIQDTKPSITPYSPTPLAPKTAEMNLPVAPWAKAPSPLPESHQAQTGPMAVPEGLRAIPLAESAPAKPIPPAVPEVPKPIPARDPNAGKTVVIDISKALARGPEGVTPFAKTELSWEPKASSPLTEYPQAKTGPMAVPEELRAAPIPEPVPAKPVLPTMSEAPNRQSTDSKETPLPPEIQTSEPAQIGVIAAPKPPRSSKGLVITLLSLLGLSVLSVGGYWLYRSRNGKASGSSAPSIPSTIPTHQTPRPVATVPIVSPTPAVPSAAEKTAKKTPSAKTKNPKATRAPAEIKKSPESIVLAPEPPPPSRPPPPATAPQESKAPAKPPKPPPLERDRK